MVKAKAAVLVSGGGTNLQAVIDALGGVIKSAEVSLVVSSQDGAYALKRAENAGIPAVVVSKKRLGPDFEKKLMETLEEHAVDMIVLAGFMTILSGDFTSRYPQRIINVHPALIPSFCGKGFYGLKVHEEALKYGVKVTGATVHYVNEVPDGGEIILQKAVNIRKGDTPETLQKRVMQQAEWKILPRAVEFVAKRILKEKKND